MNPSRGPDTRSGAESVSSHQISWHRAQRASNVRRIRHSPRHDRSCEASSDPQAADRGSPVLSPIEPQHVGGRPIRANASRALLRRSGERRPRRAEDGARGLVSRILYRAGPPRGGPAGGSHFSGTGVAAGLERPTREAEGADPRRGSLPYLAFLRVGFTEPPPSPEALVRSYRTVSPLPPGTLARPGVGGLLSAALSLASRPVAVSNHPDPWSPDFPPRGRPKTPRSDCPGLSHRRHRTARLRGAGALKAWEDQSHEGGVPSHNPGAPGPRHRVCSGSLPHRSLEFDEPRRRLLPDQPRTA